MGDLVGVPESGGSFSDHLSPILPYPCQSIGAMIHLCHRVEHVSGTIRSYYNWLPCGFTHVRRYVAPDRRILIRIRHPGEDRHGIGLPAWIIGTFGRLVDRQEDRRDSCEALKSGAVPCRKRPGAAGFEDPAKLRYRASSAQSSQVSTHADPVAACRGAIETLASKSANITCPRKRGIQQLAEDTI
jgi:hypothetical protein